MQKIYKSRLGWKEADENHEATNVLLTVDEYRHLRGQIKSLKQQVEDTTVDYERKLTDQRTAAEATNKRNEQFYRQQSAEAQSQASKQMQEAEKKKQQADKDVEAMKRRLREDSNKKRKDVADKSPGYLVTETEENREPYGTYRTVIQTPWPNALPFGKAKRFSAQDNYGGLFDRIEEVETSIIGKGKSYISEEKRQAAAHKQQQESKHPVAYQIRFRNGRQGFIEIVAYHYGYLGYGKGGKGRKMEEHEQQTIEEATAPLKQEIESLKGQLQEARQQASQSEKQSYHQGFSMHM